MLGAILKLLPALRLPTVDAEREGNSEQIAISSCISAVKSYFPCDTSTPTPVYTCLCEQYLWRISCFDNYASFPTSHLDRSTIEVTMNDYCRAAGSIGAQMIERNERRQIGNLLSSIVGDVTSVLSDNGVSVPTSIIQSVAGSVVHQLPTPANPTSIAAAITSAAASATGTTSTATMSTATMSTATSSSTTSQDPVSSTSAAASSSKSSGPSTALIAGVVVGGVAALALLGIFILLLLRHRKKKSRATAFKDKEASPLSSPDTRFPPTHAAYTTLAQNTHDPAPRNTNNTYPTHSNRNENNTYFTLPPSDISSARNTMMSPVSPLSPEDGGQHAPWASTSTFEDRAFPGAAPAAASRRRSSIPPSYEDEKPATQHQFLDSKVPVGNEMPTKANVWEIDGREVPEPSELGAQEVKNGITVGGADRHSGGGTGNGGKGHQAYRPPDRAPSVENGNSNWSARNAEGEFLGSQPVGQAL